MGWPSVLNAPTRVVLTANRAPPNKGRPPTTTSSLLPFLAAASGSTRSRSHNSTLVVTPPPPSRQMRPATLSRAHPLHQNPCACARCAVVAQRVKWEATPASTQGDAKQLRLQPRDPACYVGQQESAKPAPGNACHCAKARPGEENIPKCFFNSRCHFVLPPVSANSNWSGSRVSGLAPAPAPSKRVGQTPGFRSPGGLSRWDLSRWVTLELVDQLGGHRWMSLQSIGRICPTCPESRHSRSDGTSEAEPTKVNASVG